MSVTIITPTFNRASLLPRLYASLCNQTYTDFEWVVVDDGSTDGTFDLVNGWKPPFTLRYVFQENQGIKVAWNRGVELARGDYVGVIGSDDYYLPEALEILTDEWSGLDNRWASVNGRMVRTDGSLNGPPFERVLDVDSVSYWYRYKLAGDTTGLMRADVLRRYPFPYAESRYAPQALAFNRIARRYLTRFLPTPVAVVEYQPDGLSARRRKEVVADPEPLLVYNWEALLFPKWLPVATRARFAANCVRFGLRTLAARAARRLHVEAGGDHGTGAVT
jgi:glycosyltransferase involved in cell wall biosynthesis